MNSLESLAAEFRVLTPLSLNTQPPSHNQVIGLIEMMRSLPKLNTILEVGSHRGVSTEVLCHFCQHVIAIDPWENDDRTKREFEARFTNNKKVSHLRMFSPGAARFIADGSLDMVYIDADHTYKAAIADINAWKPKVKPGGWLAGHDYMVADWCGVVEAVNHVFGKPDAVFEDFSWLVKLP